MNHTNIITITIIITLITSTPSYGVVSRPLKNNPDIHFIGPWYGGFFASFNCVLQHLQWCEKNNKTPIVYWDNRSLYYTAGGFNNSDNAWEYYFTPVAGINHRPHHKISMVYTPDSINFCNDYIDQETREKANQIITKYIRINSFVQKKIDLFYQKNMFDQPTIGIHLRGTDKHKEVKLVSPEKIISVALSYAQKDTQFLIASDEQRLLDKMIELLKGRKIIYYDCYRSNNGKPLHYKQPKPSFAQLGEDVLVETSLLAKCDVLIHTFSNVSTGALYFNPALKNILVNA